MKLTDKTIVILGAAKFDGPYESTSFTTAKYLAQHNHVYYVDYPYTWKDYFKLRGTNGFNIRKAGLRNKSKALLNTTHNQLKILILPLMRSINFLPEGKLYRFLLRLNERKIVSRIKSVLKKEDLSKAIFINSFNFHYPDISKQLGAALNIYHCVDPLIVDYDQKHGVTSELEIIKNSDLIFCTSRRLYSEKKKLNVHTYFIPNAADLSHSTKALDLNLKVHHSIKSISSPIIGYFGNIERRMDFKLLEDVARENPDKSFVFAGPVADEYLPAGFKEIKNIYFIGRVPYEEMPSVLKGFDIAIIPFKKDEVSATIFPLKLFEYLGAGKPVVASDFNPDLKEFTGDAVFYCKDSTEFTAAIRHCLMFDNEVAKEQRLHIASENTWEKRLSEFSSIIAGYYLNTIK